MPAGSYRGGIRLQALVRKCYEDYRNVKYGNRVSHHNPVEVISFSFLAVSTLTGKLLFHISTDLAIPAISFTHFQYAALPAFLLAMGRTI
jgi:hypothetical protein